MAEGGTSSIGSLIGGSIGEAAAFAAGLAIGPVLEPVLQAIRNETWPQFPDLPLDPQTVAQSVAERKITVSTGASEAVLSGVSASRFNTLVDVFRGAPGVSAALELIRRGQLPVSEFVTVLQRNALEDEFVTFYQQLGVNGLEPWQQPLDPAVIALGIVRDTIPDPGLQVGAHSTEGSDIPQGEQFGGDVLAEFAAGGVNEERARVMVQNIGLPMPPVRAASAYFRGIINLASYYLSVAQSDSRPAWADAILNEARQILTAHEGAELRLRGVLQQADAENVAALHGMSASDADLLYEMLGRGLAVHAITTGLARGGTYQGDTGAIPEEYLDSMRRSSLRPEYFNLEYANRFTLPGYFVVKAMLANGSITVDEATTIFLQEGWPPDIASKAAAGLAPSGGATKELSVSEIKKAVTAGTMTTADALSRIEAHGYSPADAAILLGTAPQVA